MELKGEITEIIYQNELNSYTVAEFVTDEGDIVIVGYLPFINVGDTLKLTGKLVTHQDYGEQFKVDTFEKMMPQSLSSLERYLGNGTIKGVGPATAKKIVDTFGAETIHVLKLEPDNQLAAQLAEICRKCKKRKVDEAQEELYALLHSIGADYSIDLRWNQFMAEMSFSDE